MRNLSCLTTAQFICGFSAAMVELTKSMCWELVNKTSKDAVNGVAVAAFRKPTSNDCYEQRSKQEPSLCPESDDPNAAWYYFFDSHVKAIFWLKTKTN